MLWRESRRSRSRRTVNREARRRPIDGSAPGRLRSAFSTASASRLLERAPDPDAPALVDRDLTGAQTSWIEIGLPKRKTPVDRDSRDAGRHLLLHRRRDLARTSYLRAGTGVRRDRRRRLRPGPPRAAPGTPRRPHGIGSGGDGLPLPSAHGRGHALWRRYAPSARSGRLTGIRPRHRPSRGAVRPRPTTTP